MNSDIFDLFLILIEILKLRTSKFCSCILFYDSLLEKVTAWAPTPENAISRMDRALREFRIRGVSTNISFVENLLKNKTFLNNQYTTKFIDTTPELFAFSERQDRATKLLNYIASVSIQGHPEIGKTLGPSIPTFSFSNPENNREDSSALNLKKMLDEKGPGSVASWALAQRPILITDTTMRDGHQSLLATRMRTIDMLKVATRYNANLAEIFSSRVDSFKWSSTFNVFSQKKL